METTTKPAFYTLASGAWGDYISILHLPYTLWHLSYVVLGAAVAPTVHLDRLGWSVLAFFLATGLGAHALDELHGRPLSTRVPGWVLGSVAALALSGAIVLGAVFAVRESAWFFLFIGFGAYILVAYNLELFGGVFHNSLWFGLAWGAFPAITSYWVNASEISVAAALVGLACFLLSLVQRTLSTPVRFIRRFTQDVSGTITLRDGRVMELRRGRLLSAPEAALQLLSGTIVTLSVAVLLSRL
ncbi:MAG: hypothetical protein ACE5JL_05145 [Dehalococcoidia bacterium]